MTPAAHREPSDGLVAAQRELGLARDRLTRAEARSPRYESLRAALQEQRRINHFGPMIVTLALAHAQRSSTP